MSISADLFARAELRIPGGVNSPVRAFKAVGGSPVFFTHGQGAYLFDEDGKRYIDYVGSWGPMIVGHAHAEVIEAVQAVAKHSLSFGAPTRLEVELAEKICELMPAIEQVRLVNSGTEATMSAIRLARGFTKRDKILKFIGCYHGHADCLLVAAGSGNLTFGVPSSAGVPAATTQHTLLADFNNLEQVQEIFTNYGDDIAAVIVEPITGNMNCVLPLQNFLPGLRKICDEYGSLLIFDEVMTGFRVALGGAQQLYNVKPDLTTLGKVIGGGLPVGAFGGRREIMQYLSPLGPVYQAGTLSGNPLAVIAGLKTLELVTTPKFHEELAVKTKKLMNGMQQLAEKYDVAFATNSVTGMFGLFFTEQEEVTNYAQVMQCDVEQFKYFFHAMLQEGVYLAPSAYEAGFISIAHNDEDIALTLAAIEKTWQKNIFK